MTNKVINSVDVSEEIIIDDVNVAECKYLICDRLHNCECKAECTIYPETVIYADCKGINCYFKQLKHLQEENKELKKNQCCPETCEHIATEIIRYSNVCEVNLKYKETLEEIRKTAQIAKKDICDNCGWQNSDCCEPQNYTCNEFIKILDKINEVLK